MVKARHMGLFGLGVVTWLCFATGGGAQESGAWRGHFAAGQQALEAGDTAGYAVEMGRAARQMPEGLLNRPFVQYHAARGAAMDGDGEAAIEWLRVAWEEDIEALMISFAAHDPAFQPLHDAPGFVELMERPETLELAVQRLGEEAHLIRGAGANLVVFTPSTGAVLVDTGYRPALPALRRALRSLGVEEVATLIVTHPHEDHMGSVAPLGAEAAVVAHPGTADEMGQPYTFIDGVTLPPKAPSAQPDIVVATDTVLHRGSGRVRVIPVVAHTSGDLAVYLPDARVAHLGDTYLGGNPMMFPGADDPSGFLDRLEAVLDSMHPETVIVGGHDDPVGIPEVRAQIETTRRCLRHVREGHSRDLEVEEMVTEAPAGCPAPWIGFLARAVAEDATG